MLQLAPPREKVARELRDGELVEGKVVVVGLDDPVPEGPHLPVSIDGVAMGIGVACLVEPVATPAFSKVGRGKEAFNDSSGPGGG